MGAGMLSQIQKAESNKKHAAKKVTIRPVKNVECLTITYWMSTVRAISFFLPFEILEQLEHL